MLSQFSPEGEKKTLADLGKFEKDVYPVGRLDADSEGLLILTNDKRLNHELLNPAKGHQRIYLVRVEGIPEKSALERLQNGVDIKIKGRHHHTKPARVQLIEDPLLPERIPPIRYRKNIPTSWLELRISEGKNRQVRKMTAVVGYPTLRLVRWGMENMTISGFDIGEVREYSGKTIKELLKVR